MSADLAQGVSRRPLRTGGWRGWRAALILATLLLSPASAYADLAVLTDDAYIAASSPDANAGNATTVRIQAPTMAQILAGMPVFPDDLGSGGISSIALLKFDLSWIPLGTPIARARVIVFVKGLSNYGTLAVHRVGLADSCSSWTEGAVTWKIAPVINHTAEPGSLTLLASTLHEHDFLSLDVTSLVADWVSGVWPNCGVALVGSGGINVEFASKEIAEGSTPPCWTSPPAPPSSMAPGTAPTPISPAPKS